jgi:hypothetical protein
MPREVPGQGACESSTAPPAERWTDQLRAARHLRRKFPAAQGVSRHREAPLMLAASQAVSQETLLQGARPLTEALTPGQEETTRDPAGSLTL